MILAALGVILLQAALMAVDELVFHRRRGLPRWERIGHPIDTASVLGCFLIALAFEPTRGALIVYAALAALSCLLVTKDEFVHAGRCAPAEHWLHAALFVLHPLLLLAGAVLWLDGERAILVAQSLAILAFGVYQTTYWNLRMNWNER